MSDRTRDLLGGLDAPRSLSPELRTRIESALLAATDAPTDLPLGEELEHRLEAALTDPMASRLAGIDAPRPLSVDVRRRLESSLLAAAAKPDRRPFLLGVAASVVLLACIGAIVAGRGGSHGHRVGATANAPTAPTFGAGGNAGGSTVTGTGTVGGVTAGSAPGSVHHPVSTATPTTAAGQYFIGGPAGPASTTRVDSISPDDGPVAGGTSVTVHGSGFSHATAVYFGSQRAASYHVSSDSSMTAVSPPVSTPGSVHVVVQFGGSGTAASTATFTYLARPRVASVSPMTGTTGGGTWVTIDGTALARTIQVSFGGASATRIDMVSDTELRALTPAHLAGPVDVTITTPGGTSATSPADRFTYLP